jgi:hypothetical protein
MTVTIAKSRIGQEQYHLLISTQVRTKRGNTMKALRPKAGPAPLPLSTPKLHQGFQKRKHRVS